MGKCRCKYAHSGMPFYACRDTCGGPGDDYDDRSSPSQLLQILLESFYLFIKLYFLNSIKLSFIFFNGGK